MGKQNPRKKKEDDVDTDEEEDMISLKDVITAVSKLKKSIDFMSKEFEKNRMQNEEIEKLIKETKLENTQLKLQISGLEKRCNDLEQLNIIKNVVISGVPEQPRESAIEVVVKIADIINSAVNKDDIEDCYRITGNNRTNGPIVVKLRSIRNKSELMAKLKLARSVKVSDCGFKGNNNNIYINDQLTPRNSNLFYQARQLRNKGFKWVWMKEGKIFVRKNDDSHAILIKNDDDILRLQ